MTYELIASTTLGSDAASVTFSDIPQAYDDLLLTVSARTDRAFYVDSIFVEFNATGNTNNQSNRNLYGDGGNKFSTSRTTSLDIGQTTGASNTANTFGSSEAYIPNYAGSTNKPISMSAVAENNSGTANQAFIFASAGLWSDTSAITELKLKPGFGTTFKSASSFYLYAFSHS